MSNVEGQQRAFATLMDQHSGILHRVVRTYCRYPEDQHDLAQDIRMNLWMAFGRYDSKRSFSTWMYRVALNTAISWVRKPEIRSRFDGGPVKEDTTAASVEMDERAKTLELLIEGLDQMNRALLILYMDDLSHAEIGEILGISTGNVAVRISRLKDRLRTKIAQNEER